MKIKSVIFLSFLLMANISFAGRSREEMGVKFNQKKPEVTQSSNYAPTNDASKEKSPQANEVQPETENSNPDDKGKAEKQK